MKKIFINEELNIQFNTQGFIVLKQVLKFNFSESYTLFNNLNAGVDGKFYASLWSKDRQYREKVDIEIKKRLEFIIKDYMFEYESFFGDLLVKKPSLNHTFEWHQDWTFVDEEKFSSVYIWCPLQDVNKQNGCLMVLPRSHLNYKEIRGSNIAPTYNKDTLKEKIKEEAIYLPLKKGDVVIFNQALFHASPANRTFKNRLAIGLLCLPKNQPIHHYHYNLKTKQNEKYKIDYDFIMNFSNEQNFIDNLYSLKLEKPKGGILLTNIDK